MQSRRSFLQSMLLAGGSTALLPSWAKARAKTDLEAEFARIEVRSGGRLGVLLRDGTGRRLTGRRDDERFPMCSTFKLPLAAAILRRVDSGALQLEQRVPIAAADLVSHSPVTEQHVGLKGMSVSELCRATMIYSDNAAANLLLPLVGGPAGLTAFFRSIGDTVSRSDRTEPTLNEFTRGDDRDTTSPAAMTKTLQRLLLGDVLHAASRTRLLDWLRDNRTGDERLRAGLPDDWQVGDKTGSNGRDTTNDVAILWPPGAQSPLLLATYLQGSKVDTRDQNAALAAVARAVAGAVSASAEGS